MYALVLFIALIVTPQQLPINKHVTADNKANTTDGKPNGEMLPAFPSTPQAISYNPHTKPEQHNTGADDRIYRIEVAPQPESGWFRGYVIATLLIAVINFGMLVVIWRQKKVMDGQLDEMKEARKQTDSLIARAAEQVIEMKSAGTQTETLIEHASNQADALLNVADAAISQAKAALLTAESTRESADAAKNTASAGLLHAQAIINSQRPWMFIEIQTVGQSVVANEPPHDMWFSVRFRNHGTTPAEVIGFDQNPDCRIDLEDLPIPPEYNLEGHVFAHTRMVVPNETWEHPGDNTWRPSHFLTEEQWTDIRKSRKRFIYWGRLQYRDLLEDAKSIHELKKAPTIHETCFCYFWSPPLNKFLICGPIGYNKHT